MGMFQIFIYSMFMSFILVYTSFDKKEDEYTIYKENTLATHFLIYREKVHEYINENKSHVGVIEDSLLDLPFGYINTYWKASVENSIVYVYGNPDIYNFKNSGFVNKVRENIKFSHHVGENREGYFYPQWNEPIILPAFVNNNDIVSIVVLE